MPAHHAVAAMSNALRLLLADSVAVSPDWPSACAELHPANDLSELADNSSAKASVDLGWAVVRFVCRDCRTRIASARIRSGRSVSAQSDDPRTAQRLLGRIVGVIGSTQMLPGQSGFSR